SVDTEIADLLDAVVHPDVYGVAVDHIDDEPLERPRHRCGAHQHRRGDKSEGGEQPLHVSKLAATSVFVNSESSIRQREGTAAFLIPSASGARRSRRKHGLDLVLGEPRLAQDLDAVLAQPRRQATDRAGSLAVDGWNAGQAHRALGRMLDDLPEPDGLEMWIVEQRLERVDGHRGDVAAGRVAGPRRAPPRPRPSP